MQIEDEDKVKCAMYMLRKKTRDVAVMTWAEFLIEFNSKYYSQTVIKAR